jgi:hypothetical protein
MAGLAWCRRGWHPGDDPEDRDGRCPFNSTTAMVAFIVQDAYSRHMGYDTNRNWVEVTVDRPEEIERVHAALADVTVRPGLPAAVGKVIAVASRNTFREPSTQLAERSGSPGRSSGIANLRSFGHRWLIECSAGPAASRRAATGFASAVTRRIV